VEIPDTTTTIPGQTTSPMENFFPSDAPGFGGGTSTAFLGSTASAPAVGYIDSAVPLTQLRLRYDAAFNNNRPDRAEYFYAKCGCFPDGEGPPLPEKSVDYQDLSAYFEYAFTQRTSAYIQAPFRFLNPEVNDNTAGLANMHIGFKHAFIYTPSTVSTFQMGIGLPTGDANSGLGNDLASLEPAWLHHQRLSERLFFDGQMGFWFPLDGTDFAGNIFIYGGGLSYYVVDNCNFRVAPVVEVLGWTVLGGQELADGAAESAYLDTIINAKFGVRIGFGSANYPGAISNSDLYIGYGRALTGEVWYEDIYRIEYRMRF
jgi:hypothetical protein